MTLLLHSGHRPCPARLTARSGPRAQIARLSRRMLASARPLPAGRPILAGLPAAAPRRQAFKKSLRVSAAFKPGGSGQPEDEQLAKPGQEQVREQRFQQQYCKVQVLSAGQMAALGKNKENKLQLATRQFASCDMV